MLAQLRMNEAQALLKQVCALLKEETAFIHAASNRGAEVMVISLPDSHARGGAKLAQDKWFDADKACTQAIQCDPKNAKAWYRRGTARYYRQEYEEAKKDLQEALKLNPNSREIRDLLGGVQVI